MSTDNETQASKPHYTSAEYNAQKQARFRERRRAKMAAEMIAMTGGTETNTKARQLLRAIKKLEALAQEVHDEMLAEIKGMEDGPEKEEKLARYKGKTTRLILPKVDLE